MKNATLCALALISSASTAVAGEFDTAMGSYLDTDISEWASDPILLAAVRAQNEVSKHYADSQIHSMDQQWREQVGTTDTPPHWPSSGQSGR